MQITGLVGSLLQGTSKVRNPVFTSRQPYFPSLVNLGISRDCLCSVNRFESVVMRTWFFVTSPPPPARARKLTLGFCFVSLLRILFHLPALQFLSSFVAGVLARETTVSLQFMEHGVWCV